MMGVKQFEDQAPRRSLESCIADFSINQMPASLQLPGLITAHSHFIEMCY